MMTYSGSILHICRIISVLWCCVLIGITPCRVHTQTIIIPTAATIGISPNVITADVGDTVFVPIIVQRAVIQQTAAPGLVVFAGFRMMVQVNPTVAVLVQPVGGFRGFRVRDAETERGLQRWEIIGAPRFFRQGDTLALLPFVVCLGDENRMRIVLGGDNRLADSLSFAWLDNTGASTYPHSIPLFNDAFLQVRSTVWNGIPRLITQNSPQLSLKVAPNPLTRQSQATITLTHTLPRGANAPPASCAMYNLDGTLAATIPQPMMATLSARGSLTIPMPVSLLTRRGAYFCRFAMGIYAVTTLIIVE
jgi:hypothetical protein